MPEPETLELLDPLNDRRWGAFVGRDPAGTVFHHPEWLQLLHDQYGYGLSAACVLRSGEVVAGLPLAEIRSRLTGRRLVALPFSDLCRPLVAREAADAAAPLAELLRQRHAADGLPVEVHGEFPELPGARVVASFYRHLLALEPDAEAVSRRFKSTVRTAIAKARKAGLEVERRTDAEALDTFYRLHLLTRKRLGVPTQPKRFIRRFSGLFDRGLGFVQLVSAEGEPAAAAVFLTFNGTLTYKYGASHERFLSLRPNNLLFAEAITWGCAHGLAVLDFGRTEPENSGLRRFKRSWGADEEEVGYTYLPGARADDAGEGRIGRAAERLIRRSPAFVGRVAGELLYRHYG